LGSVIKVDSNAISGGMAVLSSPCQYSLRAARRAMYAFHKASLMRAFSNDEYIAITMALHEID
jgi:hypothetical protein